METTPRVVTLGFGNIDFGLATLVYIQDSGKNEDYAFLRLI